MPILFLFCLLLFRFLMVYYSYIDSRLIFHLEVYDKKYLGPGWCGCSFTLVEGRTGPVTACGDSFSQGSLGRMPVSWRAALVPCRCPTSEGQLFPLSTCCVLSALVCCSLVSQPECHPSASGAVDVVGCVQMRGLRVVSDS